jgi:DNA-binding Lrp family transcriptional regulator
MNEFISLWQKIQQQFGYYIQKQFLTFFIDQISFVSSYLLLEKLQKSERRHPCRIKEGSRVKYDETDIAILKYLAPHARMSLKDIADNLDMSPNTISSRIARLKAKGIINGFRIRMDSQKLGFYFVKIYIKLRDYSSISTIIEYLRYNPYLTAVDRNTGDFQLELEFYLEDIVKIHQIMDDLINRFNLQIKDYTYVTARKMHKYLYFPHIAMDGKN